MVVGGEVGFTEGGLVHAVRAMAPLSLDYEVTVVCPNVPAGDRVARDVTFGGVHIVSPEPPHCVRWMRSGEMSAVERPLWTVFNWPSVFASYVSQSRALERDHVDVVLGNGILGSYLAGLAPGPQRRIAVIHHLYRDPWSTGASTAPQGHLVEAERFLLRHLRADAVAVVNPSVASSLIRQGFSPDRVSCVGNGVNTSEFQFVEHHSEDSLVFVGRLRATKGVESVLDAFALIQRQRPGAVLHILGDGLLRQRLHAHAESLGVAQNVVFHGFVDEATKVRLLQTSCVYLSASRFEGFGIPVVEAMATGAVPVISDIPAHRYIFQGQDVGFLASSVEGMAEGALRVMADRGLHSALSAEGKRLVDSMWTWEHVALRYRELIEGVLSSRRSG
ncbi:MAG: glycosyltransferase family 4 protein [Dehalococcoidia bacterium]|nr:glycosyltransferase family 4 protein [Dehalococcoidia bacterium]